MRVKREKADHSLRQVAGWMGISAAYLSDLERGNRAWDAELIKDFEGAL